MKNHLSSIKLTYLHHICMCFTKTKVMKFNINIYIYKCMVFINPWKYLSYKLFCENRSLNSCRRLILLSTNTHKQNSGMFISSLYYKRQAYFKYVWVCYLKYLYYIIIFFHMSPHIHIHTHTHTHTYGMYVKWYKYYTRDKILPGIVVLVVYNAR